LERRRRERRGGEEEGEGKETGVKTSLPRRKEEKERERDQV
jgi:hypothetical protein